MNINCIQVQWIDVDVVIYQGTLLRTEASHLSLRSTPRVHWKKQNYATYDGNGAEKHFSINIYLGNYISGRPT